MKNNKNTPQVQFSSEEILAISMRLAMFRDELDAMKTERYQDVPWTPDARKYQKEMSTAVSNAIYKIEKFTGAKCTLPPYYDGDEDEFLTKQS